MLNEIAKKKREKRFREGALSVDFSKKTKILVDEETFLPKEVKNYDGIESEKLVEEFMLLANKIVGHRLMNSPAKLLAVIRRHPPPRPEGIKYVEDYLRKFEMKLDFSSGRALQQSILDIDQSPLYPEPVKILAKSKLFRLLTRAEYVVGDDYQEASFYRHFALNFDLYSHFTSPIRRLPDMLVHRVLNWVLSGGDGQKEIENALKDVKALRENVHYLCNEKRNKSKMVSDRATEILHIIHLRNNPIEVDAFVETIEKRRLGIYLPYLKGSYEFQFPNEEKNNKENLNQEVVVRCLTKIQKDEKPEECLVEFSRKGEDPFELRLKKFENIKVVLTGSNSFPVDFLVLLKKEKNEEESKDSKE